MTLPGSDEMSLSGMKSQEPLDFSSTKAAQKAHDQAVAWAQGQYRSIRNARVVTERQWYLNLSFFMGKQNVQLMKSGSLATGTTRLYTPPAPPWRARPVINRIRSTIRTELAQLISNKPNAMIVPASAEDRDMYAAMAGEQIWNNFYDNKKIKSVIRKAMWWTLVCGTGFIKTYWDHSLGPVETIEHDDGTIAVGPQGDVTFAHETPFHVLCPDFREEEIENQPFLIHAQTKSPEFLMMKLKTKTEGSSADAQDLLEDSFLNLIGTQALNRQQAVLVLEVWVKPGQIPMFPEGAFFTIVGNKIVQGFQGWPFAHGKFPFSKFDHIPSGKFYATSLIEDLIPLQKEYNRTRGQIIEAKNRMAKPQLTAQRGSIDVSKITTEPGQVILYAPGFEPPRPLPLQDLPSYVPQELERLLIDWNDLAGQHEVTHGQVPPGVTAATAISYLQERDESKLIPTFDSLEEGIEKMAQMSLSYVQQFWTTERMVRVTGPEGSFDSLTLKGSDLHDNLDIRIEAGSSLPVSKAAKQAFIMDLMKMGFIDPNKGLEIMEMGGINKLYEQIQVDQRQAQRENMKMAKVTDEMFTEYQQQNDQLFMENPEHFGTDEFGQPLPPPIIVPVNSFDNHKVHIEVHNNYRKGQAYETLTPAQKQLFEQHVQEHIHAMAAELFTQDPRAIAGLPPVEEEGAPQEPGPQPMPQLEGAPPQ